MGRWRSDIAEDWVEEGFLALADAHIDETAYQNRIIKNRIFSSIALAYWNAVVNCVDKIQPPIRNPGELPEETLLRRLGMDSGTISRWLTGFTPPQSDKTLSSIVIVLRREIEQLKLPPIRDITWFAVSRTIELIAQEDCALESQRLTKAEYSCVWWLTRHPQSKAYLNGEYPDIEEEVLGDVFKKVKHSFVIENAEFIPRAIDRWLEPYLFFRVGLLPGWECLDERSNVTT